MAADYIVQATGESTFLYSYPKALDFGADPSDATGQKRITVAAKTEITLTGFKLNAQFLDTSQALQNSVLIPLLNGGSIQLTNGNKAGSITFTVIRMGSSIDTTTKVGDITAIADAQRAVAGGDSIGATIIIKWEFNNKTYSIGFYNCTVVECPPLKIAGNDAPDYSVTFNYSHWDWLSRGVAATTSTT